MEEFIRIIYYHIIYKILLYIAHNILHIKYDIFYRNIIIIYISIIFLQIYSSDFYKHNFLSVAVNVSEVIK